jgi:hypothetical protein
LCPPLEKNTLVYNEFRPIADSKRLLLTTILDAAFPQWMELIQQIEGATVKPLGEFGSLAIRVARSHGTALTDGPITSTIQLDLDIKEGFGPYIFQDTPSCCFYVMRGLDPRIQSNVRAARNLLWIAGSSPAMTSAAMPGL